eukprot:gb/GECH01011931.1/.p1 GENE.gb/GECH01011931.1/~~gb/GECH01011931.1/.p1  ORF type:complete len:541 (+),score=126.86 gb/GECH01011931.1/:1-1623(+)
MVKIEHIINSGEIVYDKPYWSKDQALDAVKRAHKAQKIWRNIPLESRIAHIEKAAKYFEQVKDDLAREISRSMGKPISQSALEIEVGVAKMRQLCKLAPAVLADSAQEERYSDDGSFRYVVRRVPKGVIDIVAPWNYPHFTALNGIIPALLAGNTVTLKHETAPAVGDAFEAALNQVNISDLNLSNADNKTEFPSILKDILIHMHIDNNTADEILRSCEYIQHRVFTGSVNAGRHMMQLAADRASLNNKSHTGAPMRNAFIQLSLELGGSDASYVAPDADIDTAANKIINIGRLHNSGQSCCNVKRLFVHRQAFDQFLQKSAEHVSPENTVVGDPLDPKTSQGPQYGGEAQCRHLVAMVHDALCHVRGVQVMVQGQDVTDQLFDDAKPVSPEQLQKVLVQRQDRGWYFLPTFLIFRRHRCSANEDDAEQFERCLSQCSCLREESFGPLLPIVEVDDHDEALRQTNDTHFGLTCSVFTSDSNLVERFLQETEVGTVYANHCNDVHMNAVWEGVGLSGNGAGSCGTEGFRVLTFTKSLIEAK